MVHQGFKIQGLVKPSTSPQHTSISTVVTVITLCTLEGLAALHHSADASLTEDEDVVELTQPNLVRNC